MLAHFARGSSQVDWCESNYAHVAFIAEFYNTVSNAIFLVLPPFFMRWLSRLNYQANISREDEKLKQTKKCQQAIARYLFRSYSKHVSSGVNVIWALFIVIGVSSAYFHATLSLVGQLLDELAILWGLMVAFALWTPKWMLAHGPFGEDRETFQYAILALSLICTWLGFVYPVANAFVLMTFGAPFLFMLFAELKSCQNLKVRRLGFTCVGWWFVAVLFWVNDRVFCDIWRSVSFPYLHCAWHILIFIAGYTGCVLGAYFYAAREFPQLRPALTFWPCWSSEWGVPYIVLRGIPKDGNP